MIFFGSMATFDPKTCVFIPSVVFGRILPLRQHSTCENYALVYFQLFVDVDVGDVVIAYLVVF